MYNQEFSQRFERNREQVWAPLSELVGTHPELIGGPIQAGYGITVTNAAGTECLC